MTGPTNAARLVTLVRSVAFFAGYATITILWGSLGVLTGWLLPYRTRFVFIVVIWSRLVLGWLRLTCGIRHRVSGREHLPEAPCVVLARHESTWETLYLQDLFVPQATVIKRELLRIPFFGWAFALLRPIAIDRADARGALKTLIRSGRDRLDRGAWVILFPEGTRMAPGERGRLQRGGAALAAAADVPVVVVAHNAGRCWPARRFGKHPGIIDVEISPPIATAGRTTPEITAAAQAWLDAAMDRLYGRAGTPPDARITPPPAPSPVPPAS